MSVNVRQALATDVAAIMALAGESAEIGRWTETHYVEAIASAEEFVERRLWVAEADGGVVGFLAAMHVEGDDAAELANLLVSSHVRRQGVARVLCDVLFEWIRAVGVGAVELEVRESNGGARVFYERLGFCAWGRRKDYYREPAEDAVTMRWEQGGVR